MKIIKRGKIPYFTKIFTCPYCETVFEADKDEYHNTDQIAYIHDGVTAWYPCPICGHRAWSKN